MNPLWLLAHLYLIRHKLARLRLHLLARPGARVLDIGSGDGPTPAADVLCDRFVADDAERTASLCLDRPFVAGDIEKLPFRDKAFDFVYCSHVLEHTTDPGRAVAELQRIARAGYVEVPSEYLEKSCKSTPSHLWFVRREEGVLVFRPKPAGVLDEGLNRVFDERLMSRDPLYTAFHWSRFYDLFNIGLRWEGSIPFRVEGAPPRRDDFQKGRDDAGGGALTDRLREAIRRTRATPPRPSSAWRGWVKRAIRRRYAAAKAIELLDLIACPSCKGRLSPDAPAERLTCDACRLAYPWVEGVPVLVPTAAVPASART
jgi:uncharacterized protein YbaR (Trm112 family)